jgi:hypothetical protein
MSNTEFFLGVILPIVLFGALLTYVITHGPDRKKRQPHDPKQ